VKAELKIIRTADVNASATLPRWCRWNDKLSILFESHHVQWTYTHFLVVVWKTYYSITNIVPTF